MKFALPVVLNSASRTMTLVSATTSGVESGFEMVLLGDRLELHVRMAGIQSSNLRG